MVRQARSEIKGVLGQGKLQRYCVKRDHARYLHQTVVCSCKKEHVQEVEHPPFIHFLGPYMVTTLACQEPGPLAYGKK